MSFERKLTQRTLDGRLIEPIRLRKPGRPQLERLIEGEHECFVERRSRRSSPEGYKSKANRALEERLRLLEAKVVSLEGGQGRMECNVEALMDAESNDDQASEVELMDDDHAYEDMSKALDEAMLKEEGEAMLKEEDEDSDVQIVEPVKTEFVSAVGESGGNGGEFGRRGAVFGRLGRIHGVQGAEHGTKGAEHGMRGAQHGVKGGVK